MNEQIFAETDQYIAERLGQESEAMLYARNMLAANGMPDASISANQGKFLQILAMSCGAKRILELGTLGAYSTLWLAAALPVDGKLITVEADLDHAAVARKVIDYAGLNKVIEIKEGNALDVLGHLEKEDPDPFDFFFIDADKPPYLEYVDYAIRLARPGSVIVADNVIRGGAVLNQASTDEKVKGVQRLNDALSAYENLTSTIIQNVGIKEHDGMVVAIVRKI